MAVDLVVLLFDISGQDSQGQPLMDEISGVQRSVPEEGLSEVVRANFFLFKIMSPRFFALLDQTGHL